MLVGTPSPRKEWSLSVNGIDNFFFKEANTTCNPSREGRGAECLTGQSEKIGDGCLANSTYRSIPVGICKQQTL